MKVSLQTFFSSSQEKKGNSRNKQKQLWDPICDNVSKAAIPAASASTISFGNYKSSTSTRA